MRIFAMAISANGNTDCSVPVMVVATRDARSKEEAIGIGLVAAKEEWPAPDYCNHQCGVIEISPDWIKEANNG